MKCFCFAGSFRKRFVMIKEEAMGKGNPVAFFLHRCPPLIVLIGSTLLFFLAGYVLSKLFSLFIGLRLDSMDLAAFSGLIFGFCGSVLFLVRSE